MSRSLFPSTFFAYYQGMSGEIRIGTSGWHYNHWRGLFYPRELPVARWFDYYARFFNTVEINNSFYKLPSAATFLNWRLDAPPGFLYAVKASRYITHMKKLGDPYEGLGNFMPLAEILNEKLGRYYFSCRRAGAVIWSGSRPS